MYLAFVESIFAILLLEVNYICRFHLNSLFAWTVYFSPASDYNVVWATMMLASSADWFAIFCMSLSISLNTCLCIDLVLMVRHPFTKKESRIPVYMASSIAQSTVISLLTVTFSYQQDLLRFGAII